MTKSTATSFWPIGQLRYQQSVKGYFDVYSLKRIRRLQQRLKGVYCNDALFQRQNLKRKKDIYNDKRLVFQILIHIKTCCNLYFVFVEYLPRLQVLKRSASGMQGRVHCTPSQTYSGLRFPKNKIWYRAVNLLPLRPSSLTHENPQRWHASRRTQRSIHLSMCICKNIPFVYFLWQILWVLFNDAQFFQLLLSFKLEGLYFNFSIL